MSDATNRKVLSQSAIAAPALKKLSAFHPDVVAEVESALNESKVVVVGMAQNPHVRNVRRDLDRAGVEYRYLEYGSYLSQWKKRLAIKLWSGWPTFPQVFVRGTLIGGEDLTREALENGSLKASLEA